MAYCSHSRIGLSINDAELRETLWYLEALTSQLSRL